MLFEETKAKILEVKCASKEAFTLIEQLYANEISSDEKFLILALSELHNSGEINIIQLFSEANKNSFGYGFFTILNVFVDVLPTLTVDVEEVLKCLVNLTKQASRDLGTCAIYSAFQCYCCLDIDRSRKSINFILSQDEIDIYASFLSSSILAMNLDNIEEVIQTIKSLICHENVTVRHQMYCALGELKVRDKQQVDAVWELLSNRMKSESENICIASLLKAILNHGNRFPSFWGVIEELFKTYLVLASPEIQYEISGIIAFQKGTPPEDVLKLLIKQLMHISPEHKNIVDSISCLLVKLIERNLFMLAIELLESILIKGVKLSSLSYFSKELLSKFSDLRNHLITKWLLSGEQALCQGILDLFLGNTSSLVPICQF